MYYSWFSIKSPIILNIFFIASSSFLICAIFYFSFWRDISCISSFIFFIYYCFFLVSSKQKSYSDCNFVISSAISVILSLNCIWRSFDWTMWFWIWLFKRLIYYFWINRTFLAWSSYAVNFLNWVSKVILVLLYLFFIAKIF